MFLFHTKKLATVCLALMFLVFQESSFAQENEKNNLKELNQLAARGDAKAQYEVAHELLFGKNKKESDRPLAVNWLVKSANQNYFKAVGLQAYIYSFGIGVAEDKEKSVRLANQAIKRGDPFAKVILGLHYAVGSGALEQNYNKAVGLFTEAAGDGEKTGFHYLGVCYENGLGVPEDKSIAFEHYFEAASHDHSASQLKVAQMYDEGIGTAKDQNKAFNWFLKAANNNVKEAQEHLGSHYVSQDKFNDAFKWYVKAEKNGSDLAQLWLGHLYYDGKGVGRDYVQAESWYLKAAEAKYVKAHRMLGLMYKKGIKGVKKDTLAAIKHLTVAAKNNDSLAQERLGEIYYFGSDDVKNYQESLRWFQEAANNDRSRAQLLLGLHYEAGDGVAKDLAQAKYWYEKSSNNNNSQGSYFLAELYFKGKGVTRNYKTAHDLYVKASSGKSARSMQRLFTIYNSGYGVSKNIREAVYWLTQAAEYGDSKSQLLLGLYYGGLLIDSSLSDMAARHTNIEIDPFDEPWFERTGNRHDDYMKAAREYRKWMEKASSQGEGEASFKIGQAYQDGKFGFDQDNIKARKFFDLARTQGFSG